MSLRLMECVEAMQVITHIIIISFLATLLVWNVTETKAHTAHAVVMAIYSLVTLAK